MDYPAFGKQTAVDTNYDPTVISSSLDQLYHDYLKEQGNDKEAIRSQILKIEGEIKGGESSLVSLDGSKRNFERNISDKKLEIEELKLDKLNIGIGDVDISDRLPFWIGVGILSLLTLYLFIFYTSICYSTIFGVENIDSAFINPNVFRLAKQKGAGATLLILLFPVIFLALGFIIHDVIEKKKYGVIIFLIFFTLLLDGFAGYKTAKSVYELRLNSPEELETQLWNPIFVLSDINFWLIIAMGFAPYIIWGYLINYVFVKYKEIQPNVYTKEKRRLVQEKIEDCLTVLNDLINSLSKINSEIKDKSVELENLKNRKMALESGAIPVNISLLKQYISEFLSGWFAAVTVMRPLDCQQLNDIARKNSDGWLQLKESDLEITNFNASIVQ